jgi:hypothetical protein
VGGLPQGPLWTLGRLAIWYPRFQHPCRSSGTAARATSMSPLPGSLATAAAQATILSADPNPWRETQRGTFVGFVLVAGAPWGARFAYRPRQISKRLHYRPAKRASASISIVDHNDFLPLGCRLAIAMHERRFRSLHPTPSVHCTRSAGPDCPGARPNRRGPGRRLRSRSTFRRSDACEYAMRTAACRAFFHFQIEEKAVYERFQARWVRILRCGAPARPF